MLGSEDLISYCSAGCCLNWGKVKETRDVNEIKERASGMAGDTESVRVRETQDIDSKLLKIIVLLKDSKTAKSSVRTDLGFPLAG